MSIYSSESIYMSIYSPYTCPSMHQSPSTCPSTGVSVFKGPWPRRAPRVRRCATRVHPHVHPFDRFTPTCPSIRLICTYTSIYPTDFHIWVSQDLGLVARLAFDGAPPEPVVHISWLARDRRHLPTKAVVIGAVRSFLGSFLEPGGRSWSHFMDIYRQTMITSSNVDL